MKTTFNRLAIGMILVALCSSPLWAHGGGGHGGGFHGGGGSGFHGGGGMHMGGGSMHMGGGGGMRMGGGMPSGMRMGGGMPSYRSAMPSGFRGGMPSSMSRAHVNAAPTFRSGMPSNFNAGSISRSMRPTMPTNRPQTAGGINNRGAAGAGFGQRPGSVNLSRNNMGSLNNRGGSFGGRNNGLPSGVNSFGGRNNGLPGGVSSIAGQHGNRFDGRSGAYQYRGPHGTVPVGGGRGFNGNQLASVRGGHGSIANGANGAIARNGYGFNSHGGIGNNGRYPGGNGYYGGRYYGTHHTGSSYLRGQGYYIRNNFRYYNSFYPLWFGFYPNAWYGAGYYNNSLWYRPSWYQSMGYVGYPVGTGAIYYNYGDNVVYNGGTVMYDGQPYASEADYAAQATDIANQGAVPLTSANQNEQWQPLGVFAMAKDGETSSNDVFQIAINKDGIVRGNYYDATTDKTYPVVGSLDKDSQRVAWTIEGSPETVYETGLYNLTQDESGMLVHRGQGRTEQFNLFRLPDPNAEQGAAGQNANPLAPNPGAPNPGASEPVAPVQIAPSSTAAPVTPISPGASMNTK